MPPEIWKVIDEFSNYAISNLGRLKTLEHTVIDCTGRIRVWPEKIHKCGIGVRGYRCTSLRKNGKTYSKAVHILVGLAFIPKPMGNVEINHKNGNRSDATVDNLEWVSHSENAQHSIQTGLRTKFTGCCTPKFDHHTTERIRRLYAAGMCMVDLAGKFKCTRGTISRVVRKIGHIYGK